MSICRALLSDPLIVALLKGKEEEMETVSKNTQIQNCHYSPDYEKDRKGTKRLAAYCIRLCHALLRQQSMVNKQIKKFQT